ncbi:MAG: hypothetical protein L0Y44_12790 [Phycisphaerales bacterium]|nr:hypothetical protein [Phycisphaerales bacterium]
MSGRDEEWSAAPRECTIKRGAAFHVQGSRSFLVVIVVVVVMTASGQRLAVQVVA